MTRFLTFIIMVLFSAALPLATGCSDSKEEILEGEGPGNPVVDPQMPVETIASTITASLPTAPTRTHTPDDTGTLLWSEGDGFGLYYGSGDVVNRPYFIRTGEAGTDEGLFDSTVELEWNTSASSHTFYAVYPYNVSKGADMNAIGMEIPAVQVQGGGQYFGKYDCMTAKAEYSAKTENIEFEFTYPFSVLNLTLDAEGSVLADERIGSYTMTAPVNFLGDVTYNLVTDEFSDPDQSEAEIRYDVQQPFSSPVTARIYMFPVDLSGREISVTFSTDNYDVELNIPANLTLEKGQAHNLTADIAQLIRDGKAELRFLGTPEGEANSYMVTPGSTIAIPVSRAYKVWSEYMTEELNGEMTAELLWQDAPNLINSVSVMDADKGSDALVVVKTNRSAIDGNALLAFKVDGVVRWSWHVWLTEYNPDLELKGSVFFTNNGQEGGDYYFMDRNLGATSTSISDFRSRGYFYQWGRKDPFPGQNGLSGSNGYNSWPLYDINNTELLEGSANGGDVIKTYAVDTGRTNMLQPSIENPTWFYSISGNWYSSVFANRNDYLWRTETGAKTVFDPCPEGWRVPANKGGVDPFAGSYQTILLGAEGRYIYAPYELGIYPYAGRRNSNNGSIMNMNMMGYYWTAECHPSKATAYYLMLSGMMPWYTGQNDNRAHGQSVRCAKDI